MNSEIGPSVQLNAVAVNKQGKECVTTLPLLLVVRFARERELKLENATPTIVQVIFLSEQS